MRTVRAVYNSTIDLDKERSHQQFMHKQRKIVIIGGCGRVGLPLGLVKNTYGRGVVGAIQTGVDARLLAQCGWLWLTLG